MLLTRESTTARRWFGRWVAVVTAGEALGFAVPAAVGAVAADSRWFLPFLLLAGAVEGALLGASQALVLRHRISQLNRAAWVWLTVVGAVLAYAIGVIPSSFVEVWTVWPLPAQVLVFALLAICLLGSIGTLQWVELRRHIRLAGWWIAGTAVAWLLGLGVFFTVAPPLWHDGQHVAVTILIGVLAGVLMAAAMAVVTGVTLTTLPRTSSTGHDGRAEGGGGQVVHRPMR